MQMLDIGVLAECADYKNAGYLVRAAQVAFQLPFNNVATSGTVQVLKGAETASNTPGQPNLVVPTTSTIATGKTINFTAAAFSVSVIRVQAS